MRISRALRAVVAGALTVCGAFAALPSADAATPASPHRAGAATAARANVTVITQVQNAMDYPAWIYIGEKDSWFGPIDAHSTRTSDIQVPWVGNSDEVSPKSIRVYKEGLTCPPGESCRAQKFHLYYVFQDYWQPNDQVKYTANGIYDYARPVSGPSTGGGDKRLIIAPDQPYM
ncbi:hypothetical protein ACIQWL_40640 [Streptomyces mirabilis]|uniref:hypothetical protein n=1 Tax=Streptomyces mirabilis TaxID=68239 RepID=UPI000765DB5E